MPLEVQTPDWVKDAVFYQIFPDRFARSQALAAEKPNNLVPWDAPSSNGYFGGDLLGVVEHLDHIQALGVTALYFCPIFQSASYHRYHTHDYYQVDPLLGGTPAFLKMLDEAHRRGLRVVLDGVFNHASRGFFYFNDILENGAASPYVDWFTINKFPVNAYDHSRPADYGAWWGLHALPKFNTDNPRVREYLMQVAEHWLRLGIDGWRLDVPGEVTTAGFWEEFRTRVKAVNREAYIVGEIWDPAVPFLQGDRFDGVMNYQFTEAVLAYVGGARIDGRLAEGKGYRPQNALNARGYAERIEWLLNLYPWEIQLAQMNLLDSHDTARVISLARGDEATVRLATLLLMTFPGAACIYQGDEIGQDGGVPDWDSRRPFPWDRPGQWRPDVFSYHQALIALRKAHTPLRRGTYHALYADDDVYVFARRFSGEVLLVAVNAAENTRIVEFPAQGVLEPGAPFQVVYPTNSAGDWGTFTNEQVTTAGVGLTLAPRSGVVVKVG
jgi:cyclomaltodextrinase / maltogenic alpha-amylase / neopullulanase